MKKKPQVKKKQASRPNDSSVHPRYRTKLQKIIRRAPQHQIVQGAGFLYFSIQPAQEEIHYRELVRNSRIRCYSVLNTKQNVIGYFLQHSGKPLMNLHEFGAALFYSKQPHHKKIRPLFTDQKLRVLAFDERDFFVSVKWKSSAQDDS